MTVVVSRDRRQKDLGAIGLPLPLSRVLQTSQPVPFARRSSGDDDYYEFAWGRSSLQPHQQNYPLYLFKWVSQDPEVLPGFHSCLRCYVLWSCLLWQSFLPRTSCPGFGLSPGLCGAGTWRAGGPAKARGSEPRQGPWRKRSGC